MIDIIALYASNQPTIGLITPDVGGSITALAAAQEAERFRNEAEAFRNESETFSELTNSDRLQTELDRLATSIDRVATGEDRVQTGLDRIATGEDTTATAADRVQTGLDVITTGEDRVATDQDKLATAADRVQTGLDVIATGEDRVATGQDKLATAADRVQTGLDRVTTTADRLATEANKAATAADRVQTGLDAAATAADRVQTGLDVLAAQDLVNQIQNEHIQTAEDATATAADRIQTGLDRVATGEDRIATAADRVATGEDRIATAEDRTQTSLDRVAIETLGDQVAIAVQQTSSDRVQTGLDVIAAQQYVAQIENHYIQTGQDAASTAADRVQTGLDAEATAADRVQTGLDRIATGEDRVQTGLDVATTLDYKDAAEVAAAAALTNSQVAGEHRVATGGFADSAEQSAIQAQASLQNILDLGDMTFITVEGAGLITRAGVPFVLNLIKRDSYIVYSVAATGGAVTLEDETITYIGTELGMQTITISAGAATRVLTIEVVSNELGTAPDPAPNIGDPLEGGFYTGNIIDTATTATGSFTLSVSAITLTIPPADLPKFYVGQQIRLGADPVQGGSSAGLAEGVVIAGTGNQLSLDITNVLVGSGSTFSSWVIAIGWKIIIAPRAQGENAGVVWKTSSTAGPIQTQTLTNGPLATSSMIALNTDTIIYPLAKWILDTNATGINGYSDWYIPARDELELIWRNLKPITNVNSAGARATSAITYNRDANISTLGQQGTNDNSIPTGVEYTSDIPAQTSVVVFRTGGIEAMQNAVYWSSSEFSSITAWYQYFLTSLPGYQYGYIKNASYRARAVRRSIL